VSPRSRSSRASVQTVDGWPPRWLTEVPVADLRRSRGGDVVEFGEALCRITKDSIAGSVGQPIKFRPWQSELTRHLLAVRADGRLRHRQALIGLPRKNGKSSWLAVIALEHLLFGPAGGEVYSCAADREQARLVFGTVREMVRLDPELSELLKVTRDAIFNPTNGATYRCLSAEAFTKEGLNPTLVAFDEVHAQPNRELWDVMALAMGARVEPLLVGITTAGVRYEASGQDSLCYGLYQYGKRVVASEVEDPSFFFAWWEASLDADHRSRDTWAASNPGFGDLVAEEDFQTSVRKTPEAEFRTKRTNAWVSGAVTWLPSGVFESRAIDGRKIEPLRRVVLAFDGSRTGDTTGFTVHDVDTGHCIVGGLWERPPDAIDWSVPRSQVKDEIRAACRTWDVVEIAWDEYLWLDAAEELEAEGLPVQAFPQTPSRTVPATQRLYEDVMDGRFTHDGDPRLVRHVGNASVRTDARGSRLAKEHKHSNRKIDLAVCAVMGNDRAAWWRDNAANYDVAASLY